MGGRPHFVKDVVLRREFERRRSLLLSLSLVHRFEEVGDEGRLRGRSAAGSEERVARGALLLVPPGSDSCSDS